MVSQMISKIESRLGEDRIAELEKIGRYSMYDMKYRWSLRQHIQHLQLMLLATLPYLDDYLLNKDLALAYATIHDDPELYPPLGDVQAAYKAVMARHERERLEKLEEEAVVHVIERFESRLPGYGTQLHNYRRQFSPEAQLVHFLDKITAFYEAMHELKAGGEGVITAMSDSSGRPVLNPFQGYPKQTQGLIATRPFLSELVERECAGPFVAAAPGLPYLTLFKQGQSHTFDWVKQRSDRPYTGYSAYGAWLKMILDSGDEELIERLYIPNPVHFANCRS